MGTARTSCQHYERRPSLLRLKPSGKALGFSGLRQSRIAGTKWQRWNVGFTVGKHLGDSLCSASLWATPWVNTPGVTPQIDGCAGIETTRPTFPGQSFRISNLRQRAWGPTPVQSWLDLVMGSVGPRVSTATVRDSQLTSWESLEVQTHKRFHKSRTVAARNSQG